MENTTLTPEQIEEAKQILLKEQEKQAKLDAEFNEEYKALLAKWGKKIAVGNVEIKFIDVKKA